jgi:hypothetical protein
MAAVVPVSETGENPSSVSSLSSLSNARVNVAPVVDADGARLRHSRRGRMAPSPDAEPYSELAVETAAASGIALGVESGVAPAVGSDVAPAIPWWLWWNVLSIDAPMVAVAWAAVFARGGGGKLATVDAAVLFLSVWVIYVSDRLLDGWTAANRGALRERHFFCERHAVALVSLLAAASGGIFWLTAEYLPAAERDAGLRLGLLLVLYLAGIHAFRGRLLWALPKEIFVGVLFACGVTLPIWSRGGELRWEEGVPWTLFALLCCLNCLAIEDWERRDDSGAIRNGRHRAARFFARADAVGSVRITAGATALAGLALIGYLTQAARGALRYEWLAVGLGALLLLALSRFRKNFSPAALRVLADVAVLVPAALDLAMHGWGA